MQTLGIENENFQDYQCSLVLLEELTGRIQMKVQIKIQIQTQIQIQADEKSWRWPQSGNELNEPAGEQWRPLGADLATGFASTIARIKYTNKYNHNTQTNTKYFCEEYVSKYANKYKIHLQRKYVLKYTSKKIEKKKTFQNLQCAEHTNKIQDISAKISRKDQNTK